MAFSYNKYQIYNGLENVMTRFPIFKGLKQLHYFNCSIEMSKVIVNMLKVKGIFLKLTSCIFGRLKFRLYSFCSYYLSILPYFHPQIGSFQKFEFTWSVVSCVLFFISSTILLSAYVQRCSNISGLNTAAAGAPACTQLLGGETIIS